MIHISQKEFLVNARRIHEKVFTVIDNNDSEFDLPVGWSDR